MLSLQKLKQSGFFESISLQKGDFLFREGEKDNFLYIIEDGEISIEKNILLDANTRKKLALISIGNIIGEGSLCHDKEKEVSAIATRDTSILRIEAKKKFLEFFNSAPKDGFEIIKSIIDITNTRLLRANKQITSNFEVIKIVNSIQSIDNKSIFGLLDNFMQILECEKVLFFEKNGVIKNYYTFKYDSSQKGKLQDKIIETQTDILSIGDLLKEGIQLGKHMILESLTIGSHLLGTIVAVRDDRLFHENDEKILASIANSFVSVIRQKSLLEEEKNKSYIKQARK